MSRQGQILEICCDKETVKMSMKLQENTAEKFALMFAQDLVAGKYDAAHQMLTVDLRSQVSPKVLRDQYESMIEYWDGEPASSTDATVISTLPEGEITVYVAIFNDCNGEAVTTVVIEVDGHLLIREIEWGRP
jgi:hypothetical protein